jgi:hypothetical protein
MDARQISLWRCPPDEEHVQLRVVRPRDGFEENGEALPSQFVRCEKQNNCVTRYPKLCPYSNAAVGSLVRSEFGGIEPVVNNGDALVWKPVESFDIRSHTIGNNNCQ